MPLDRAWARTSSRGARLARAAAVGALLPLVACGGQTAEPTVPVAFPSDAPLLTMTFVGDTAGHGIVTGEGDPDPFAGAGELLPPSDLLVFNLEGVLAPPPHAPGTCVPIPGNHLLDAHPHLADFLLRAPFSVATLANNHACDCGTAGLNATLAALLSRGVLTAGAGPNVEEAGRPLRLRANGIDVAILAYLEYPEPDLSTVVAGPARTGVASWEACDGAHTVAALAASGAYVITCFHLHTPRVEAEAAVEAALAAGADLVVAHGPHVPWGVLVQGSRIALLSLGNFLFAPGIVQGDEARDVVTASVSLHAAATVVTLRAGRLDAGGLPVPAPAADRRRILARVAFLSKGRTPVTVTEDAAYVVAAR